MPGRWRAVLERGLGDTRTRILGVFLIIVAVVGTVLMRSYANIETVFAASLLAGSLLGRWWTILVPLTALAILQPLEWSTTYAGYGLNAMTGITFFVVSGYVFVGFLGRRIRPRVLFRVKSVALLTTISVPVTIAYDLWTALGEWYFITRPFGVGIATILEAQVPFTLYHLLSSLIFVPLFGSIFLFLHTYGWPARASAKPGSRSSLPCGSRASGRLRGSSKSPSSRLARARCRRPRPSAFAPVGRAPSSVPRTPPSPFRAGVRARRGPRRLAPPFPL